MKWTPLIRKIHIYTSLALLLLVLLFTVTGFMLNHHWWPWTKLNQRTETEQVVTVRVPETGTPLEIAQNVLQQLGVSGEIFMYIRKQLLTVRAIQPGHSAELKVGLDTGQGTLKQTDMDSWETIKMMHEFDGLHGNMDASTKKNWTPTQVWSLIMDLTVLGLLLLMGTGVYMWLTLRSARRWGLVALELGTVAVLVAGWLLIRL